MQDRSRKKLHQLLDKALDEHAHPEGMLIIAEVHEGAAGAPKVPALLIMGILGKKSIRLRELIAQLREDQTVEG